MLLHCAKIDDLTQSKMIIKNHKLLSTLSVLCVDAVYRRVTMRWSWNWPRRCRNGCLPQWRWLKRRPLQGAPARPNSCSWRWRDWSTAMSTLKDWTRRKLTVSASFAVTFEPLKIQESASVSHVRKDDWLWENTLTLALSWASLKLVFVICLLYDNLYKSCICLH